MGKIQSIEWLKAGYSDLRSIKHIIEQVCKTLDININELKI